MKAAKLNDSASVPEPPRLPVYVASGKFPRSAPFKLLLIGVPGIALLAWPSLNRSVSWCIGWRCCGWPRR